MNELISVIIPVYNVEAYLERCVSSIVGQTYGNLEIFLIDDGSTDSSSQICDEWAEKDSRIRVIHKENGGQAQARNMALDVFTGDYVAFVDSDDYIEHFYIEYLYQMIKEYGAEISICGFKQVTQEGRQLNQLYNPNKVTVLLDSHVAMKELCNDGWVTCSPWCKLFKRDVISDIRFPEGHIYEDMAIVYKWIFNASNIVVGDQALYYYVQRSGSTTTSEFDLRRMDAVQYVEQMCSDIVCRYPDLHDIAQKRLFIEYAYLLRSISLATVQTDVMKHYADTLYQKIKITRKTAWKQGLTLKQKYYAISSAFGCKAMQYALCIEAFIYKQVKLR